MTKAQRGGAREGAGRKSTYGEPTLTMRVPASLKPAVANMLMSFRQTRLIDQDCRIRRVRSERVPNLINALEVRVRAGAPASGDDQPGDAVDLGSHLVRDPDSTFVMKVQGWSMRDSGILDGDELVVDTGLAPDDGRIVIADVAGELTVKRLKRSKDGWRLQASNPEFEDIVVNDDSGLRIVGVVTRVIRSV